MQEKDVVAFNVEHVLPQAFGRYENNLTLDCVCSACNQLLGDTVDLKFARDSVEGLDRFLTGAKPAAEFKHYGRNGTTRVEVAEDGPMKGAWLKYTPSATRPGDSTSRRLYDERPERRIVDVVRASDVSSRGHALSIAQNADGTLSANITLHFRFLYKVQLTQAPISETIEDATHFFDAVTHRVHQVS